MTNRRGRRARHKRHKARAAQIRYLLAINWWVLITEDSMKQYLAEWQAEWERIT